MASPNRQFRPSPEFQQKQDWLDQISRHALVLLRQESQPQAQRSMRWAERRLSEANLWSGNPPNDLPSWTAQVIARNPDLMGDSLPHLQERDLHPEKAESFESLVLQLIPSESGL